MVFRRPVFKFILGYKAKYVNGAINSKSLNTKNKIEAMNKAKINNSFPKSRFLKTKEKSWKNVSILEIKLFIKLIILINFKITNIH